MLLPNNLLWLVLFVPPMFPSRPCSIFKVWVLFEACVRVLDFFYAHFMDYGLRLKQSFSKCLLCFTVLSGLWWLRTDWRVPQSLVELILVSRHRHALLFKESFQLRNLQNLQIKNCLHVFGLCADQELCE